MCPRKSTTRHLARLAAAGVLAACWLCTPVKGLSQSTDAQTGAPSLDDLQKRLDQLKTEQSKRRRESQHHVVQAAPPAQSFAGTWELVSSTADGIAQKISPTQLTLTQEGTVVHFGHGRKVYRLTSSNTITYQVYYAHGQEHSYQVQTSDRADLIDTFTLRVDGPMLIEEVVLDFQNTNFGHPPGKQVHIREYRRVEPQDSTPDVLQGQTTSEGYPDSQAAPSPQSFAGTWEMVSSSFNGVEHDVAHMASPVRWSITQDGPVVRINNQEHRLTTQNTITYQVYWAHGDPHPRLVQTPDQADLIVTIAFRLDGPTLVDETISYCRAKYYECPAGRKTVLIRRFRRVAEPPYTVVRTSPYLDGRNSGSLLDYYPAASRRAGETGRAEVQVCVSPDGTATSARILTSSGFKSLDDAAIKFFRDARFNPATEDGTPVAACRTLPAVFRAPQ